MSAADQHAGHREPATESGVTPASVIRRILVGVDGSPFARLALEWAVALARPLDAEVIAVHVAGLLERFDGAEPVPVHGHLEELETAFSEWCRPLEGSGVRWRGRLLQGPPVPTLLRAVSDEGVDVVVVGTRGTGGFPELRLGSTSHQLAEHAGRPVLIVPPDAPAPNSR